MRKVLPELLPHDLSDVLQHLVTGFVPLRVVQLVQTIDINVDPLFDARVAFPVCAAIQCVVFNDLYQ